MGNRRSYGQYCGLARALDVIGDRWSLLIVRELLAGPKRYGELHVGLQGVATNLLAQRLRDLEQAEVIERKVSSEANGVLYALTAWGSELRETVEALVRWSTPLMVPGPGADSFRPEWLSVALQALLRDRRSEKPVAVVLEVSGTTFLVRIDQNRATIDVNPPDEVSNVACNDPHVLLGLVTGLLTIEQATDTGALRGDLRRLKALLPSRVPKHKT